VKLLLELEAGVPVGVVHLFYGKSDELGETARIRAANGNRASILNHHSGMRIPIGYCDQGGLLKAKSTSQRSNSMNVQSMLPKMR